MLKIIEITIISKLLKRHRQPSSQHQMLGQKIFLSSPDFCCLKCWFRSENKWSWGSKAGEPHETIITYLCDPSLMWSLDVCFEGLNPMLLSFQSFGPISRWQRSCFSVVFERGPFIFIFRVCESVCVLLRCLYRTLSLKSPSFCPRAIKSGKLDTQSESNTKQKIMKPKAKKHKRYK